MFCYLFGPSGPATVVALGRAWLAILLMAGWLLAPVASALVPAQTHQHSQSTVAPSFSLNEAEPIQYICPMHSHITSEEPGTCPICGMDLVPQRPQSHQQPQAQVSSAMQQSMGVRTAVASHTTLWRYLVTQGQVQWNDNARHHVHARASGWIERLHVRSEGQTVSQGQLLYEIYSRELVVAQQDYLQASSLLMQQSSQQVSQQSSPQSAQRLLNDSRLRLELLGFAPHLIEQLEQRQEILYRVPVFAPKAGVVTQLNSAQGMYVEPGLEIMTITGTDQLWLEADVPEQYSHWFSQGTPADITIAQLGLTDYETSVSYVYPELDVRSRSQRLRIELPAKPGLLVGMQAKVELFGGPKREVLAVPLASLIVTGDSHGSGSNRVLVQTDDNTFVQRPVEVGLIVGDQAEIIAGLAAGERVVVSGQFLLDSEATLQGMHNNANKQEAVDAHQHH